jgi:hypothetical protein
VLQSGGEFDLPPEAVRTQRGRELLVQHLQGYRTFVPEVVGQIDRRHAAVAELALYSVAIAEGFGEGGIECGNGDLPGREYRNVQPPSPRDQCQVPWPLWVWSSRVSTVRLSGDETR